MQLSQEMIDKLPEFGVFNLRVSRFKGETRATEATVTETFKPQDDYKARITELMNSGIPDNEINVSYRMDKSGRHLKLVIVNYSIQ